MSGEQIDQQNSQTSFFIENELKMNRRVSRLVWIGISAGPALMLGRFFDIYYKLSYINPIIFTLLLTAVALLLHLICKKNTYSPLTKYICLYSIELLVCFLAMTKGLCLFLSYLIVPCLSCMYYDEKFTRNVSITCYIAMAGTLVYRTLYPVPEFVGNMTKMQWILAYGSGLSIEYFICMLVIYNYSKSAHETLANLAVTFEKLEESNIKQQKAYISLQDKTHSIQTMQKQLINGFANLVESKDPSTGEHIRRTSAYVILICTKLQEMGYYTDELTNEAVEDMVTAAPLHDLGKIGVSNTILCKPGRLTPDEFNIIKQHPSYGERLIKENMKGVEDEAYIKTARDMALYHHERWDGTGYPIGLKEKNIPLSARIMSAADVLDALIHKRPYKEAYSLDQALEIMKAGSGTQFDPAVIRAVLACTDEIKRVS